MSENTTKKPENAKEKEESTVAKKKIVSKKFPVPSFEAIKTGAPYVTGGTLIAAGATHLVAKKLGKVDPFSQKHPKLSTAIDASVIGLGVASIIIPMIYKHRNTKVNKK